MSVSFWTHLRFVASARLSSPPPRPPAAYQWSDRFLQKTLLFFSRSCGKKNRGGDGDGDGGNDREGYDDFVPVDAVYALPVPLVEQLGLRSETREARPLPPGGGQQHDPEG